MSSTSSTCWRLAGDDPGAAKRNAQIIMRIETDLAKASLTRVEQRDPYNLKHKLTRPQLEALTPAFDWNHFLADTGLGTVGVVNVTEPAFFKELNAQLRHESLDHWKTYLRWHLLHSKANYLSTPFVTANFDFYGKYLRGVPQMQPRWKRCVRLVDEQLGEALGQEFVAKTFGPEVKQRTVEMTKQIEVAMGEEIRNLTWMSPSTKDQALTKLHTIVNKIGYPDKWRDYSAVRIARDDFFGDVDAGRALRAKAPARKNRQARRSYRMGHDASHGECLLRPSDE